MIFIENLDTLQSTRTLMKKNSVLYKKIHLIIDLSVIVRYY